MSFTTDDTPRRAFIGTFAVGAATLVAARLAEAESTAFGLGPATVGDEWVAKIKGKHKQVFDNVSANDGWGAAFPINFLDSAESYTKLTDKDYGMVSVFRHFSMPLMLNDDVWAKYRIGAALKINDPKTNAPATRNIFRENVPLYSGLTYEQIMTKRGVIFVACNMALTVFAGMTAANAGVSTEVAQAEWKAGLIPGVYLAPSGVYAVNRAQEAGCTYCYGG